jgi:hypothetical protein
MKNIRNSLCALLLTGAAALAGTFTANFDTPDTSTFILSGSGALPDTTPWMPFIATNRLLLTVNQNNLYGGFSPVDFDSGAAIQAFTATFKLQFGPGSGNAADGASFSFGPGVDQYTAYSEVGAGANAFAVSFHTYTSSGGPAVDVFLQGARIAHYPVAKGDMVNSTLQDVMIQLNRNSTLNVSYRGQVVINNLYLADWGPTPGFFNISGRTGGENEETDIDDVNISTTLYTTPVAPVFTSNPTNVTVAEGGTATFSTTFDGTGPFTIQWYQRGTAIPTGTSQTLTLSPVYYADNNSQITCEITTPGGTRTSSAATLTVIRDVTAPTVQSVSADKSFTTVLVKYSEPVSDTALTLGNYGIDQSVAISTIARLDASTVVLTTSKLAEGTGYNLTINNVQDMATTPNTIAANTIVRFQTFQFMVGTVVHQKYTGFDNAAGSNPDNLFADPRFINNQPDRRDLLTAFEYPAAGGWFNAGVDSDKVFFDTMEGYFIPPANGNYVFFISFSDRGWLFLSNDDNPANKLMIAGTTGWSDPRSWLASHDYDPAYARSDQALSSQWPTFPTITLEKDKRYYMLMVHHMPDWAGGSWCDATYKLASDTDPANGTPSTLIGSVVGSYIDPTGTSVTFTQQPQDTTVSQGQSATFSAAATGTSPYGATMNYQWQTAPPGSSTFTNIPAATGAILQTPGVSLADNGRKYRLVATVPPVSQNSSAATLMVTTDTTPPVVSVGAMTTAIAGTINIGVGFDEPVDDATGSALANYSVSSGTITGISWYSNRFTANSLNPLSTFRKQNALLTVTGFSGTSGTLTVRNVKDAYNNAITSVNVPFTVNSKMKWGVVGANEFGGWNAAVPVAANGWDIYSDGMTEWANYDEATFVYEPKVGDFDVMVRVKYQDASSTWARAGLIARDVQNFGVDRATQLTAAGRYQKCHVNPVGPVLSGPGSPGNAAWEGNRRLDTGGQSSGAVTGPNSIPQYPSAWCRIKRVGQTFTIFRSDDGANWVNLGSTTWGVDDATKTPMPDTVYVGPEYTPENGNITQTADQGTFLAQFRDYGDYVFNPQLKISFDSGAGKVSVTWTTGTLMSSSTPQGTFTEVSGATSPYVITPGPGATFFRVKQ